MKNGRLLKRFFRHGHLPIREDDCSYLWHVPAAERCEWVEKTQDCYTDSVVQYTAMLFCIFRSESVSLFVCGIFLIILWLSYLFLILRTTADNFFCPSLAVIANIMRLSENIAGVTILTFGNGAPDIFTSLVSGSEDAIIMFTELIGAGVFVTTVIAGSIAMIKPFRVHLKPLIRDTCFYIAAVCWITYVLQDERVYLWEAISLILLYVLFIANVVIMQACDTREEKVKSRIPSVPDPDVLHAYLLNKDTNAIAIPRIPTRSRPFGFRAKLDVAMAVELDRARIRSYGIKMENKVKKIFKRPRGLFEEFLYDINPISREDWTEANRFFKIILIVRSPATFLLQLFIPVVNVTAEKRGWSKLLNCFQLCVTPTVALFLLNVWRVKVGMVPILPIFFAFGTLIGVIVFLTTHADRIPKYHNVFAFFGFFFGMLAVYLVAGEVMAVLGCIGFACSISDAMLGITFLAVGNSIGDFISNITIAQQGFPKMGYAACFGGPIFNTLLGLGLTYGISAVSSPDLRTKIRVGNMAPGCLTFLLCSLLTTIIYLNITGAMARRSYGYLLYSLYLIFILIQFLSEFHVIHPLGMDHRADESDGR
ncbi:PREDICTED: sodium/potassium/calcium exchanger 6, mitochondrial-like [Polistes canadensis]|uniref:sodium/potassium/calcium exchanger 6, mitochondrial-like n=1 Tax=Polistes canadensis TaxID=91411 RepID=UPI000718C1C1|nr:PREDICTED: sodium/potassium/calcium exchanger 6, mitochondrial-like [Polistes canadensis]